MIPDDQLITAWRAVNKAATEGIELPLDELEVALDSDVAELLQSVTQGQGGAQEVGVLVRHHWPDILLDDWQAEIIWHILSGQNTDLNEVTIKGCTAAGKGFAVSLGACLWFQAAPECKIIITSQRHKHAHDVMFGEVLKCRKRMRHACPGDNGIQRVRQSEQKYIVTVSPFEVEGFSGQHGPATLFVMDEATAVPEDRWDQAKTQAACMVALANPRTMSGWFRGTFPSASLDKTQVIEISGGRRYVVTVGGSDCMNVREGAAIIPSQITRERYMALKEHPNPRWSRVMADGLFPEEDEDFLVIVPSWLERHLKAWRRDIHVVAFGLDVAASEAGDRTVLAAGGPGGCASVYELQDVDTMRVVGWVVRMAQDKYGIDLKANSTSVVVDMDGLGKGVGDRLAEIGVHVIEFRGNATSEVDSKQYANLRAEAYGELGRRLDPRGAFPDEPWGLPKDADLLEDLCAPERIYSSDGVKFKLTPKDNPAKNYKGETIRQKLGRSPDKGDAVVYLYHGVRAYQTALSWHDRFSGDILASGEDPVEERRPFTDKELEELPDYLKELVTQSRLTEQDRKEWEDNERWEDD